MPVKRNSPASSLRVANARSPSSPSGLARLAGLDPTTFNKSKRGAANGKLRWPSTESLAKILSATGESLDEFVATVGQVPNVRARMVPLIGMAQAVSALHGGIVPREMDQLRELPGVGRKTANVVLGNAYGINVGVTVDTHVTRVAGRLRLTRNSDPALIEQDLMPLFPRKNWTMLSHLLIWHGRRVCVARRPRCDQCVVNELCPSAETARSKK